MPPLSIIIPIHNDLNNGYLSKQISLFKAFKEIEVIYVDGGSSDGTVEYLNEAGSQIISYPNSNRAQRINKGISLASSHLVLINHPKSLLDKKAIQFLIDEGEGYAWGGFTHNFDSPHPLLKFTSWYSNQIRGKLRNIFYLDHCWFINLKKFKHTPVVPEIDIFEDTIFCEKLSKENLPNLFPYRSLTSSIRFRKNGIWFQSLLNQVLKVCWYIGLSPSQMNKVYEKGLELNSKI